MLKLRIRLEELPVFRRASAANDWGKVFLVAVVSIAGIVPLSACELGPRSGAGLRLPNGDLVRGKQAFQDLRCNQCHSVAGEIERVEKGTAQDVIVDLGGKVAHIATHGELVTSIVNPSHGIPIRYRREGTMKDGNSKMTNFNEVMTVKQLIDLTEYLQSKYVLEMNQLYGSGASTVSPDRADEGEDAKSGIAWARGPNA